MTKTDIAAYVFRKLFSARFLAAVSVIFTFCLITCRSMDLLINSIGKENFTVAKDIFLFTMGAFTGITGSITTFYFMRNDRAGITNGTEETKHQQIEEKK